MSPVLSHTIPSELKSSSRSSSTSSLRNLISLASAASSATSLALAEGVVDVVREEGLRHAPISLHARHYKTSSFVTQLLECLRITKPPSWSNPEITPQEMKVHKVSGSLTNAVFFVSCPTIRGTRTLLLRIYGASSGALISRPRELHTLHILSSQYHIGPRVYGTFENGRIEEYFDSTTLTSSDIRNPTISRWIGARMAELHSVDIQFVEGDDYHGIWDIGTKKNVQTWIKPAQAVLALPSVSESIRAELDLHTFELEWAKYLLWVSKVEDVNSGSKRVFAHNDAQYGNLLRLTHLSPGLEEHRQIIVVDFEYAGPNPASFDIANHFHEWTANYHSATPHILDRSRYPTFSERRNFYLAYIKHTSILGEDPVVSGETSDTRVGASASAGGTGGVGSGDGVAVEEQVSELDREIRIWSPASHAMWAIWGIVQAREDVEGNVQEPEFDYIGYARCRMAAFREAVRELQLLADGLT